MRLGSEELEEMLANPDANNVEGQAKNSTNGDNENSESNDSEDFPMRSCRI